MDSTGDGLPPADIDGVDFALDDQPDLHSVLAGLRRRRDYAIVPSQAPVPLGPNALPVTFGPR
jgi:hypothetical protein